MYRLLSHGDHARDFLSGWVRLSTLSACRSTGAPPRRDAGEGSVILKGSGPEEPIRIGNGYGAPGHHPAPRGHPFSNGHPIMTWSATHAWRPDPSTAVHRIVDAYLLSLTVTPPSRDLIRTFGAHCIEIHSPTDLFHALTQALVRHYGLERALFSRVSYCGREFRAHDAVPLHIAFLKPEEGYAGQHEARMLWELPIRRTLRPHIVRIPDVERWCRYYRL